MCSRIQNSPSKPPIIATPTLAYEHPVRPRRIIGDLSDVERVLDFLGIELEREEGMITEDVDVAAVLDRVQTGVQAFDELVMGGLPRARTIVVGGTPGSGKTVFATQFLAHGMTTFGENGVLVTFEEPPADIEANMRGFGWELAKWRKDGRLGFVDASPPASDELIIGDFDLVGLLSRIQHAVKTVNAKRVVLGLTHPTF